MTSMKNCMLCPRMCGADRESGKRGRCGCTDKITAARASLHMWEEPCISGKSGSGAVFFSGCPLGCIYCQNREISRGAVGKSITAERLSEIFFELRERGAANINLVTATHFTPMVAEALRIARSRGLGLPIVWNSGGYERAETLRLLDGAVNIYLPDFKYCDSRLAKRYSDAPDYFEAATEALDEMVRQTGAPVFGADGMMKRGTIVRHLCLPGCAEDSKRVIKHLHDRYGDSIYISIMSQYTPVGTLDGYPELNRRLTEDEYDEIVDFACDIGVVNGYTQEGEAADESFIPQFDCFGI